MIVKALEGLQKKVLYMMCKFLFTSVCVMMYHKAGLIYVELVVVQAQIHRINSTNFY